MVLLAVASAIFGVVMLMSRLTSSAMSGMNMSGSTPVPASAPAMDPELPGMDMPGSSHDEHGSTAEAAAVFGLVAYQLAGRSLESP